MIKTRVTEILGTEYPIIQGALANIGLAELVAAVSNAGGLGNLASITIDTAKEFKEEIKKVKRLTDKPFSVNITFLPSIKPVNYEEYFDAAFSEEVKVVETAARNPEKYVKLIKSAGVIWMHKATRVSDLLKAERLGADMVTIDGYSCGGHPSMDDVGTIVLIPAVANVVKVPIIAAGGIGDARGFVGALALGADAVMMGTRFMLSKECTVHPKMKEWMLTLKEYDTMIIQRSIKNTTRVAKTGFAEEILKIEERGTTLEELLPLITGKLSKKAMSTGETREGLITIGQVIGLINDVPTAKEIIDSVVSEARPIFERLSAAGI